MKKVSQRSITMPPWKKLGRMKPPHPTTLEDWRRIATEAAKQKGGRRACGLCKRATLGAASVEIRQPWPSRTKLKRWLCSKHYVMLTKLIREWEVKLDDYDQPIDKIGRGSSTGGGILGALFAED